MGILAKCVFLRTRDGNRSRLELCHANRLELPMHKRAADAKMEPARKLVGCGDQFLTDVDHFNDVAIQ